MITHPHQGAPGERYMSRFEDAPAAGLGPDSARIAEDAATGKASASAPTLADPPAVARMQAARAPLQAGDPRRMGRYRLVARLGSGGMGVVYLGVAEDGGLVAVKVLRPVLADDPVFQARFDREAATLARVRGAHVVRVIEAGADSGAHFLVTEYAAGPSLARYVDSAGPLGTDLLHRLAIGLAEALTVIHAADVVHRDLKPANVILTSDGPKVIDFGIAQVLGSTSLTQTGMTVGTAGYMPPEQVMGHADPPADIFAWAVTVAYAASGLLPFGTGPTETVLYRIIHGEPNLAAVPRPLRPIVGAALAKEPQRRPTAAEILGQLAISPAAPAAAHVRAGATPPTVQKPAQEPAEDEDGGSVLLEPSAPVARRLVARRLVARRLVARRLVARRLVARRPFAWRTAGRRPGAMFRPASLRVALAVLALVVALVAALAVVLLPGRGPQTARPSANQGASAPIQALPATAFGTYPGLQDRDVFQTIGRVVAAGNTIVTTGEQVSGGVVRQQFFASTDGGASWRLAAAYGARGGPAPTGHAATRLAGGPAGWVATGPQAIWTSRDGLTWTLAATHGITPLLPGDQVWVLNATANGFVAAGQAATPGGGAQAVIWTSRNGLTWQRMTAAQAGLGSDVTSISYATWGGHATVIAGALGTGGWGTWLSTDGGTTWTQASIPADHGAQNTISGLGADGSGLIAIRPGAAGDAIAYFSPNGQTWRYAATIGGAGGFSPAVVKGSEHGFVVTGTGPAGSYLAYTAAGDGTAWAPTGSLGAAASYASVPAATVGTGGTVIAAGSTAPTKTGQQAVVLQASTTGAVRPVPVDRIPGAVLPEIAVNALAAAGGQQIAVGSANGYPAIWRKTAGGSWTLISSLPLASAGTGQTALTSVTHGPAGWLAVGTPGPVAYTSTNGITWQYAGSIAADLHGVVGVAAAAGPRGYAIVGKLIAPGGSCVADVWWDEDMTGWTRAHDVNETAGSSQVLAVAGDANGFISAGSHNGQPAVWTTTDGTTWTTIVLPLRSGATSGVLQQIAISGNRAVALGQQTIAGTTMPLAELSVDGGATWRQVPFNAPGPDPAVTALTADAGAFTAAVRSGQPGQQDVTIWTSAHGASWTRSQLADLSGRGIQQLTALAPFGTAVTGITSAVTAQTQQPIILTLPAR